jgi:hypothetical protein
MVGYLQLRSIDLFPTTLSTMLIRKEQLRRLRTFIHLTSLAGIIVYVFSLPRSSLRKKGANNVLLTY